MSDPTPRAPWLTIIGIGEDGPSALSPASRAALDAAEAVFGGPRHLALAGVGGRGHPWPVPFDTAPARALRGRRVVALVSGDPFWFGAGTTLTRDLTPGEWTCHPAPSTFALAAARLGWPLEGTLCRGLHAAPFARLRRDLAPGVRLICTLRDEKAPAALAGWLRDSGWQARLWTLERLGGPQERVTEGLADTPTAPVAMAVEVTGGPALGTAAGRADHLFAHDGQITKAPVRALTLAALQPRPAARLWDLGAGSGSVSVEWALAGGTACAVERRPDRCANIAANIAAFGLDDRITLHPGTARDVPATLPPPDAVFVGGGFDAALFAALPRGIRLVVNAVTLATQGLLADLHRHHGGDLLQIGLAPAAPLGPQDSAFLPARPIVQWAVNL
jgi:precorrin-6Y C5,15-methyltransferase (decarboxylating)